MQKFLNKNCFLLIFSSLMMIGAVSSYAADKKTAELTDRPLEAFKVFVQQKKDEIGAKAHRNSDGRIVSSSEKEIGILQDLIKRIKTEEVNQGVSQGHWLSPQITDYITAQFFSAEYKVNALSKVLTDPLLPSVRMSFPLEAISILSAIVADRALSQEQLAYLERNSIPFDKKRYFIDKWNHGIYRKSRFGKPGYGEGLRRPSIKALETIGKHQELPFRTLLVLVEGMTDPLENNYVT